MRAGVGVDRVVPRRGWRTRSWPWWATTRGSGTDDRRPRRRRLPAGGDAADAGRVAPAGVAGGVPSWRWASWSLLPLIILLAFEFGGADGDDDNGGGAFGSLVDLATAGRAELRAVHPVRLGRLPAGRGGGAVLRRHGGQRGELGSPALPAGASRCRGPGCWRQKLVVALGYSRLAAAAAGRHGAAGRHAALRLAPAAAARSPPTCARRGPAAAAGASSATWPCRCWSWRGWRSCCRCRPTRRWARSAARCCCDPVQHPRPDHRAGRSGDLLPPTTATPGWGCFHAAADRGHGQGRDLARSCYATLFWALAFWRFTRKDVTLGRRVTHLCRDRPWLQWPPGGTSGPVGAHGWRPLTAWCGHN